MVFTGFCSAQNETKKWYFGNQAGLDFSTNPPTVLTNGTMNVVEGCASMSDASGNLLFYTNGSTIYTQTHTVMANGTGLNGGGTPSQSCIIIRKPGSLTLYYIFTVQDSWNNSGSFYSVVDMSLAAGQGSVTIKNAQLSTVSTAEKITATKHCNGVDYWVLIKDNYYQNNSPLFRAYALTPAGVSTVAVTSPVSNWWVNNVNNAWWDIGCMKISPNGKKLGCAIYNNNNVNANNTGFELYDFDNTTGAVSNSLALTVASPTQVNVWWGGGYGCEFSPDGTKFYGSRLYNNIANNGILFQWDLCAGSNTAIVASQTAIATYSINNANWWIGSLQLAPNGKIYAARYNQSALGVINNPNALGSACNYVDLGQSISPKTSWYGLPNFVGSHFIQPPPTPPFTHTVNNAYGCQTASFTAPPIAQNFSVVGCAATGYSLVGLQWNFGDPTSGAANTSTVTNPAHAFTTLGTYTTQLILYYSCGGGTDTIKQVVNVNQPCISVNSTSITCANLGSATVTALNGVGPFSYTWMPSGQTNSVATGLSPGSYTLTVHDFGNNFTYTATTVFTSLIPLTGTVLKSSSVTCNGANTATATVINLAGGSGFQNFVWTNGSMTYTTAFTNSLSAGLWSVTVSDALTGCTINDFFLITQPFAMSLSASANSPSTCAGTAISFTASNSGGTPGTITPYTYTWTGGPATDTYTAIKNLAGNYVFTVMSQDSNLCLITQTISANYVPNPTLSVGHVSICPLQTGTLSVSGASSYTWTSAPLNPTGSTFTDNPLITQQYSVIGSALSCTSSATASIILKPVPVPVFSSNSPICNGQNLVFSASTATSSVWTGTLGFVSVTTSNTISVANPNHSGVYHVTVTAANSCTAATQGTVTVHPTPTLSATGSTVCVTQTLSLSANSFAGANYVWTGPNNFLSSQQNPTSANPLVSASGNYSVKVTSAVGCTNSAIANVTVTALPVITFTSNSPQCFGNTLTFNASATTGALVYSWNGPNGFTSALQSPNIANVTVPASGTYSLTVTTGPCVISASHAVTIHPLPAPVAFNSGAACEGKSFQLGVNNCGVLYQWFGPNGFNSTVATQTISNVTLAQSGIYSVIVIDANTCQNVSSTSVSILQNPIVHASGELVCFGEPAQLSANGAATYYWLGPSSFTANVTNPIVAPTINTQVWTYTVTGTAVNGCTAISTTTIGTRVLPVPSLTVTPRVCVKSEIKLQGLGGNVYQWTGPLGYNSTFQNPTFIAWNIGMAGTYSLMVIDLFGCKGYTTASVVIDSEPGGALVGDHMSGCVPFCSSYSLQASGNSNLSNAAWQIGNQSFSSPSFSYCFTKAGEYEIKGSFENEKNCKGNVNFVIQVYSLPDADFYYTPEHPVEGMDEVNFVNNTPNIIGFNWQSSGSEVSASGASGNWQFNSTQQSPSYLFAEAGVYGMMLIVKNEHNCKDTVMKVIKVETDQSTYVPNAFTPNDDGLNDTFFPVMRGVKKSGLQIFDRWGELIFASEDPNHTWDGTYKGQPCKEGIYNWKLSVLNNSGEQKNSSGTVTLYR